MTETKKKSPPRTLAKGEETKKVRKNMDLPPEEPPMAPPEEEPMYEDEEGEMYEDKGYYKALNRTNALLGKAVKAMSSLDGRIRALEKSVVPPQPVAKGDDEEEESDEEDDSEGDDMEKSYTKAIEEQNRLLKQLLAGQKRKDYPIEEIDEQESDVDHYEEDTVDEEPSPTASTKPTDPHGKDTAGAFTKSQQAFLKSLVADAVKAAVGASAAPSEASEGVTKARTPRPAPVRKSAPVASDSPFDEELMLKAITEDRKVKGHKAGSGRDHMAKWFQEARQ